ncbi:leucyl aminopeptidase [Phenylobacterium sp.]|uniref:leucyl aminopeptidase n=1 Tax=Phenylobacterium sp. TaxID=1871053 RepID=UPI0027318E39|nr:leucyl aminopeptidase [Phenylobacterium sp.]MDP1874630.1 leucyl aminopeptidase [Phenylobacterium sp.]
MDIQFVTAAADLPENSALAIIVFEGAVLSGAAAEADSLAGGVVGRALAQGRFTGAKGQVLDFVAPAGHSAARLVLVGAGKRDAFDAVGAEHAAASAYSAVKLSGLTGLRVAFADEATAQPERAALGVRLGAYRFDRYRTKEAADKKPSVVRAEFVCADVEAAQAAFTTLAALADGIAFARDLVSEPPNILYPVEFARRVKALETLGLEVEILGEAEMQKLGMGSLLGVGQGSARESQLAIMRWNGAADPAAQPIAFVGKGVCFDTGGISIKPAEGMEDMKWDMGGAAAVAGLMHALAGRKAKVNAVGVLGLVENMPDGDAQRPGDVVTSMSGQTIEIINTDAEGRLVLADALWYCQDRFKPKFMVDLATLTGAIIISLGNDYAGVFSNNDELADNLLAASKAEAEPLWRMPLPPAYDKQIDSMIADMKNTGGRAGGSITAALFLQRFVNDLPWAHMDIASTAWKKPSSVPTLPEGATGYGVRLLNRMVADRYES